MNIFEEGNMMQEIARNVGVDNLSPQFKERLRDVKDLMAQEIVNHMAQNIKNELDNQIIEELTKQADTIVRAISPEIKK